MKKTQIKFLTMAVVGLLLLGTYSCKDDYTEEDALKAQQEVDLAIFIVDNLDAPIVSAKVTVSYGSSTVEATTNDKGLAFFPNVQIGTYAYSVSAENFTTVSSTGSASPSNFRQAQVTVKVILSPLGGETTATIRGNVTFDKDLTNTTEYEPVSGIKVVYAQVSLNSGTKTFSGTTDTNGNYQITVPTNGPNSSTSVTLRWVDFEADQVIAFDRYADDVETTFPKVLPRKETIKTVFSIAQSTNSSPTRFFEGGNQSPLDIRSLYAIAEPAPAGKTTAVISSVSVNANGEVTGISFSNGGDYTGDADSKVNVTITSLDGGSGASISIPLTGNTTTTSASVGYSNNSPTIVPGSGYPTSNYSLNKTGLRYPSSPSTSLNVNPGQFYTINADYGTGYSRPKILVEL
jgi:hypothetical protein